MDPILLAAATAAGLELSSDVEELTEEEQAKVKTFLEQTSEGPDKVKELESKIEGLTKKLSGKEDPAETKVRTLEEAGFKEEATLLSEYRADKMVERISSDLPKGHRLSPVVEKNIRTFAMANDTEKLLEVAQELATGKGVVNLNEEGTGGGDTGGDDDPDEDVGAKLNALAEKKEKELEIEFDEAYNLVVTENPKLWNEYQLSHGSRQAQVEVV